MKTVVDLLAEYGALADTRTRRGGTLVNDDQSRFDELEATGTSLYTHFCIYRTTR